MKISFSNIFNGFLRIDDFKLRLKRVLFVLGKDAFLFILFIFLVEVIFAELLFYQYVLSVDIKEPSSSYSFIGFREDQYQSILKEWQTREDFLENYSEDSVSDPFQP